MCEYTQVDNAHFNIFLRRRARLPLPGGVRQCLAFRSCHSFLDRFGDHLAACPSTGMLKRRGTAFERVYRPIWKEAGVRETPQPFVKDFTSYPMPTPRICGSPISKSGGVLRGVASQSCVTCAWEAQYTRTVRHTPALVMCTARRSSV